MDNSTGSVSFEFVDGDLVVRCLNVAASALLWLGKCIGSDVAAELNGYIKQFSGNGGITEEWVVLFVRATNKSTARTFISGRIPGRGRWVYSKWSRKRRYCVILFFFVRSERVIERAQ